MTDSIPFSLLICVCSILQLLPLVLIHILPDTREEQRKLRDSGDRSVVGSTVLAVVLVVSLVGTIALNIILIFV